MKLKRYLLPRNLEARALTLGVILPLSKGAAKFVR
jgi:hypothetical protein